MLNGSHQASFEACLQNQWPEATPYQCGSCGRLCYQPVARGHPVSMRALARSPWAIQGLYADAA